MEHRKRETHTRARRENGEEKAFTLLLLDLIKHYNREPSLQVSNAQQIIAKSFFALFAPPR